MLTVVISRRHISKSVIFKIQTLNGRKTTFRSHNSTITGVENCANAAGLQKVLAFGVFLERSSFHFESLLWFLLLVKNVNGEVFVSSLVYVT